MTQAFIRAPSAASPGEIITIKVLIRHPMESGQRRDRVGQPIPRNIINRFSARYDGEEVFAMDLFPGIAANPYLEFKTTATRTAELVCSWADDAGEQYSQSVTITVSG
ncbi:MAG: thiosulfate oxidation carrier complex protein SoxZ [Gammaproteobacteria bacterium]|nr:thiosulfate oxidation carrier complex protein SoxZ [Gammaproteobacteria bacterium]